MNDATTEAGAARNEKTTNRDTAVAAARHTVIVLLVLTGVAALTTWQVAQPGATTAGRSHVMQYLVLIGAEWLLVRLVAAGMGRHGVSLRGLIAGGRPLASALGGVAWRAVVTWVATFYLGGLLVKALQLHSAGDDRHTSAFLLPHGPLEIVLWIVLASTAGICEEIVYRGYLQRQFIAFTRRPWLGIVLTSLVFGAGHAYQGWRPVCAISIFGLVFGMLARRFNDLRPGILAHAFEDLVSGLGGH